MRIRSTLALAATALAVTALPAAAGPEDPHDPHECEDEVAHLLHDVEPLAGDAGWVVHLVEGEYCHARDGR